MFAVGQTVWSRDGWRSGTVPECDGNRVFIAQDSGPYRTMREYSDRPGELGLLMGKGLADGRKAG